MEEAGLCVSQQAALSLENQAEHCPRIDDQETVNQSQSVWRSPGATLASGTVMEQEDAGPLAQRRTMEGLKPQKEGP